MQLDQLDKANEILVKSIRRASDYAPTNLTMAMVLQRQGDPARAIVYAKRAVELQPAMSAAHALLGRLALQQGDLVASSAYFEESLSIGNSDPSTREVYAMVLLDLRETREALTQFGLVLQVNPSRTISIGGFAVATARLGNVQGALGILQEALKSAPTDTNLQRAMNTVQQLGTTQ
jgi:tetratricopeptide (TPR) repeat protein